MNGLNFKGKNSFKDFGLIVKTVNVPPFTDVTRQTVQIPGMHGVIDFGCDTYGEKQRTYLLQKKLSRQYARPHEFACTD